jgi:hypothetical protein
VRVDALPVHDPGYLVDGVAHRLLLGERGLAAAGPGQGGGAGREQRRAPAAVAAGGAEADRLRLHDDDAQARVGRQQVVRGPQPGEACADHGHVGVGVTRQRRPRGRCLAGGVLPQAQRTPQE